MMKQSNKTNLDFLLKQFSQNGKEKENPCENFYSCFYGLLSSNILCDCSFFNSCDIRQPISTFIAQLTVANTAHFFQLSFKLLISVSALVAQQVNLNNICASSTFSSVGGNNDCKLNRVPAYSFQENTSVIVLYMSGQEARTVLDSVKRNWRLDNKSIVWIAPDQWGKSSYFLNGLFTYKALFGFC